MIDRARAVAVAILLFAWLPVTGSDAGPQSLLNTAAMAPAAGPIIVAVRAEPGLLGQARGSLFAGRQGTSLLARPARPALGAGPMSLPGAEGLRRMIAQAEAGADGYDAVVWSARIRPAKPPSRMTIADIYDWIDRTPGQNHAIGRYQFIPATLRRLVSQVDIPTSAVFSPEVQDRLADRLLEEAGLTAFLNGGMGRTDFMNNLAKIWAGLPSSQGKSHYHGLAGNRATMTWARFEAEMRRIFPG